MSEHISPDPEQFLLRLNAAVDGYLGRMQGRRPQGTKTWLAHQLSCDRTTLYKYLDGTNRIPLDTLRSLLRLLDPGEDEAATLLFLGNYGIPMPITTPQAPPPTAIDPASLRAALAETLAQVLPGALNSTLADQLSLLTGILSDIRKGQLSTEEFARSLAGEPALQRLLHALAGHQVSSSEALISFGAGAQAGDITFRDTAGRDLVRLELSTGNVYNFYGAQVFISDAAPPQPSTMVPASASAPQHTLTAPNPFGRRGRIDDPAQFFGRDELLRRVFEELGKGSNLSLIGEREIGKSSLLCMIQRLGPDRLGLPAEALLHIDMQVVHSEDDFFEALCTELGLAEPCRGYRLARRLRGRRHILCLDEIEKMRRDRFSADVRDELRGLADGVSAPLTLVVASSLSLADLFPDKLGEVSPLANICSPLEVPPFTRSEARAFLETRLEGTGVRFSDEEIADLLERSGRHPARLQQAAAVLYRRKAGG